MYTSQKVNQFPCMQTINVLLYHALSSQVCNADYACPVLNGLAS